MKPRLAARVDDNAARIVAALRAAGASVLVLDVSEQGAPDLLVAFLGANHLLEVKGRLGKLSPAQLDWHQRWRGPKVCIVRSAPEALRAMGITGPAAEEHRAALGELARALHPPPASRVAMGGGLRPSVRRYTAP